MTLPAGLLLIAVCWLQQCIATLLHAAPISILYSSNRHNSLLSMRKVFFAHKQRRALGRSLIAQQRLDVICLLFTQTSCCCCHGDSDCETFAEHRLDSVWSYFNNTSVATLPVRKWNGSRILLYTVRNKVLHSILRRQGSNEMYLSTLCSQLHHQTVLRSTRWRQ